MAKIFIHRPVLAMVVSLVILIAGGVCIPNLPIAQYPDICPPEITVSAAYTGANAEVLESSVASCIEQEINGAEGMLYMKSSCTNQGYYTLTITFDISRDQDLAMVDVQNRIAKAQPSLPNEVVKGGITVAKQSSQNLMYISIYSPDNSRDQLFLSNYVTINVIDQLARIGGIGSAKILAGQRDYSMRIWAEPDKMSKMRITCDDIVNAISTQSIQAAAGSIGDPPQTKPVDIMYPVNVEGRLSTPEQFANCIVKKSADGVNFVRLKDVATVEQGALTYNTSGGRDRARSVLIAIYQQPGANAVELARKVTERMNELQKNFPEGVAWEPTYDSTIFVTKSIEEVVQTLFEAIVLVLIVIMVFLGNFRATVVPVLAVPVSLVGTFAGFAALGFSINLLTMFGLVLAVGIVVDDAIVVVEAVELHIEHGMTPLAATERAMEEVSGPVVAIALVLCAVFVPVAFMGGMTGIMYRQFAITLAVSVLLSAVVALTLTPALCAMLLRPRKQSRGPFALLFGLFNKVFAWLTKVYVGIVRWSIKLVVPALAIIVAIYGGAYYFFTHTPGGFIPNEDMGNAMFCVILDSGASLSRTDAVCMKVNEIVLKQPGVKHTLPLVGYHMLQGAIASNAGLVVAVLDDWDKRKDPNMHVGAIIKSVMAEASNIDGATVIGINPPPVPGLSQTGGLTMQLQDRSGSQTPLQLAGTVQNFCGQAMESGVASLAYSVFNPRIPFIHVDIDRDKVINLGVPVASAFMAMQVNLGGYYINQYNLFGRTWRVMLQADSKYRRTPDDIGKIYLRSDTTGNMIPLRTVSLVEETTGPEILTRYNLYRSVEVNANPAIGGSSALTIAGMEKLADKLPAGYGYEWTSTAYQQKQSAGQTGVILIFGLVFVFLFLAAQYESWGVPFAVMLSMPTVILGALAGVSLVGMDLNIYVQIGILTLIGLSAKNAILIVEYAKANYERGLELVDATVEGARLRFRPILMTSFAFILGVVPLAMAEGASAVCRRSLGISVMCGMTAASILGIIIIPSLYVFVQGFITKIAGDKRDKDAIAHCQQLKAEGKNAEQIIAVLNEEREAAFQAQQAAKKAAIQQAVAQKETAK